MNKRTQYTVSTGKGDAVVNKTIFAYDPQTAAEEFAASMSDWGGDGVVDGELVCRVDVVDHDSHEKTQWNVFTLLVTRWFAQKRATGAKK